MIPNLWVTSITPSANVAQSLYAEASALGPSACTRNLTHLQ